MRAVIQRVGEASVTIGGQVRGSIGLGCVVLLGIEDADTAGVLVRCKSRKAIRLVFDNLFMKNVAVGKLGAWVHPAAIIFHARSKASLQPGGIEFNNCFVYEPAGGDRVLRNHPVILLTGGYDDMFWTDVSGQVTASVPGGARKRIEMEVKDFTLTLNDESRPFAEAAAKWTNGEDKEAVAQVMAGNRTIANAAWWGPARAFRVISRGPPK